MVIKNYLGGNCVIEDPKYVASEYLEAYDFITTLEAKKN